MTKLEARIKQLQVEATLDGSTIRAGGQQSVNATIHEGIKNLEGLPGPDEDKYLVVFLTEITPGHDMLAIYSIFNEYGGPEAALDTAIRLRLGKDRERPWCAYIASIAPLRFFCKIKAGYCARYSKP